MGLADDAAWYRNRVLVCRSELQIYLFATRRRAFQDQTRDDGPIDLENWIYGKRPKCISKN
jgi:hypothetical protein